MRFLIFLLTTIALTSPAQTDRIIGYVSSYDGVPLTYDVRGNGAITVVLVHCWSCDRTYWSGQTNALSRKYKVVAIDLAGHGGSGQGRQDYTMESFGGDVAAVVEKLKLEKIILVGHSMGGDVVVEAARRLSQPGSVSPSPQVLGLIMIDSFKKLGVTYTPEAVHGYIEGMRPHFKDSAKATVRSMFVKQSDPKVVDYVSDDMSSAPSNIALSALENVINHSGQVGPILMELKLPVIMINADNEPTDMASMKKYGAEVVIQKGVGHFGMLEDPVSFNGLLAKALISVAGQPR